MPPRASVQGTFHQMHTSSLLSLSDLFYVFLLLRNYHTVQFFYWCSRFSAPRNYAFLSFRREKATASLTIKTYLAAYSLKLILLLYGVFVILSGLVLFTLEKGSKSSVFNYVQNSFWALAAGSGADPALVDMRKRRILNGFTVVSFYSQMRTHRRVLTAARGKKDRNFDLQLTSFSTCTSKHFR